MEVNKKGETSRQRSSVSVSFNKKTLFKFIVKLKEKNTSNGDDLNNIAKNH